MRLSKLPRGGHWEVDVVPGPEGQDVHIALVVLAATGLVRMATPVRGPDDVAAVVVQAALEPVKGTRGRPATLRCRIELKAALAGVAKEMGASLRVCEQLPSVDEIATSIQRPPLADSPPEGWTKASTVLLDFAAPMGVDRMMPDRLEPALRLAATVWSAVVLVDHAGDAVPLDRLRELVSGDAATTDVVEALILRKRTLFSHDPRIMEFESIVVDGDEAHVNVSWHLL